MEKRMTTGGNRSGESRKKGYGRNEDCPYDDVSKELEANDGDEHAYSDW